MKLTHTLKGHDWSGYVLLALAVYTVMLPSPSVISSTPPNNPPVPSEAPYPSIPSNPPQELPTPVPNPPLPAPSIPTIPPTPPVKPREPGRAPTPPNAPKRTDKYLFDLFADLKSPGVNAIAAAEGNRYPDGRNTPLYERGHVDPGNGVFNRGWCSDQGRGKDNADADIKCLERTRSRMARITKFFRDAGLDPTLYPEAWVNALDLWNQARPEVGDNFASKYAQALKQGKTGTAAILNARVESFRDGSGEIRAAGLLRICQRSPSRAGLSPWMCVATDQARRMRMIRAALQYAKVI